MNLMQNASKRRIITIASLTAAGAALAGAGLFGAIAANADGSASASASGTDGTAAVTTAELQNVASTTAATPNPNAVKLRAALKAARQEPKGAARREALEKVRADVLAGKYGPEAKEGLTALIADLKADPAGMRGALWSLAGLHPDAKHPAAPKAPATPAPSSGS